MVIDSEFDSPWVTHTFLFVLNFVYDYKTIEKQWQYGDW